MWFNKLGFKTNPLSIKPVKYDFDLLSLDILYRKIFNLIILGSVVYIEGNIGLGKTTLLNKLRMKLGMRESIYYSCNRVKKLDLEKILDNRSLIKKIFKKSVRILVLDECQYLQKDDYKQILDFFNQGNFQSIVLAGSGYDSRKIPEELLSGLKHFKVPLMSEVNAIRLINNRMRGIRVLSDEDLRQIFYLSDSNPRSFLINCEDVFRYYIDNGLMEISEAEIKKIISKPKLFSKEQRN